MAEGYLDAEWIFGPQSEVSQEPQGETMSPRISNVPFMEPNQSALLGCGAVGTMSAIGFPKRVMQRGCFVFCT